MSHFYISVFIFLLISSCALILINEKLPKWKLAYIFVAFLGCGALSYRTLNVVYGLPALLQTTYADVLILGYWPDKANKTMYMWLKEPNKLDPISVKMPYSMQLHKQLEAGREKHKGKPYRSKIEGENFPLEKFGNSIDNVEVEELQTLPVKPKE